MLERYGFSGLLKLFISLVYTKLFYSKARLLRMPIDIRNRRNIRIGKKMTTGTGCRLEAYPQSNREGILMSFGDDVEINDYVHITAMERVSIGNNVLIASKVYISDCTHGSYGGDINDSSPLLAPSARQIHTKPVIISDNVWIGEFVSILPGVTIGKGAIIGTMSVVSKSIPEYSIAVGSPAKVIKTYNFNTKQWERI